jgi:hypothetical protein
MATYKQGLDEWRKGFAAMHEAFEHSQASDETGSGKRSQERLRDEQAWARMDDDGSPVVAPQRGDAGVESEIDLSTSRRDRRVKREFQVMADTGENRQIIGRANAKQAEAIRASSKMVYQDLSSGNKNNTAFAGSKDGSSSGYMPTTSENSAPSQKAKSKVEGPIRCHKCQMLCVDAGTYLAHRCTPRASTYMPTTSENAAPSQKAKSNVEGSIRCHQCQMLCVDAGTYVAHTCTLRASSY